MAGSLNKAMIIGNVGRNPEISSFSNGNRVCNLSVATTDSWKDKTTGEKRERTEWHRVTIFAEGLIKLVEQYVKQGAKIYVEGAIQTREYEDKNGIKRYTTEIVIQGFSGTLIMLGDNRKDGNQGG